MRTNGDNLPDLPKGWVWTELATVITKMSNGISRRQAKDCIGTPVSRIETIANETINLKKVGYLLNLTPETIEKYKLRVNDILFSNINSDSHLGKTALFNIPNITLLHGMNLLLLRPNSKGVDAKYFNFLINHYRFSGYFVSIAQHAVNQSSINQTRLKSVPVCLPPLAEQRRIVAKIEELFTRLDAGVEALKKVKAELKRYRQAVLKAAFEGKLTAEWREKNKNKLEPASRLLERIAKEREKAAKGKAQKLPALDTSNLPEPPNGWEWARLSAVANIASGQTPEGINEIESNGEIPFYKVGDMNRPGNEVYMKESQIYLNSEQVSELGLHIRDEGTVIFPKRGGAISTNKKRILSKPSAYDLNTMGVLTYATPSKYFYYWISSIDLTTLADGSNVPQINHKDIEPLILPIPPFAEQDVIIAEIERHFSIADEVDQTIENSLRESDRLRQSILKRAFEGKLVPQDPADEPAEKLLERIKAEKAKRR